MLAIILAGGKGTRLRPFTMTMTALDYAEKYGLKITVVRPFNILGAGVPSSVVIGAILELIKEALKNKEEDVVFAVGNLDTRRDFIAADDVVDAYIAIMYKACWGEVFNICSGIPRSVRSILNLLISNSERNISLEISPDLIRHSDVPCSYVNGDKAYRTFGFKPKTETEKVLKDTWDYAMQ